MLDPLHRIHKAKLQPAIGMTQKHTRHARKRVKSLRRCCIHDTGYLGIPMPR